MTQASFPKLLSSQIAFDIARAILDGFDHHYSLFRQASQAAKGYFEQADCATAQRAARECIDFYDQRVQECVHILENAYAPAELNDATWRETKRRFIGLLSGLQTGHKRPELAESFFNSVSCHILHRHWWQSHKERIQAGIVEDVFPYPQQIRFHQPNPAVSPQPSFLELTQ